VTVANLFNSHFQRRTELASCDAVRSRMNAANGFFESGVAGRDGYRNTKGNQLEFAFPFCLRCFCCPFIFMRAIPRLAVALPPLDPIRPCEALLLRPFETPVDALAVNRARTTIDAVLLAILLSY